MSLITDLSKFGKRDLLQAAELLKAYAQSDIDFKFASDNCGAHIAMNPNSGSIFLTNEDSFEVIMFNGDNIEHFYSDGYAGQEGFKDDILAEFWDNSGYESDRLEWVYDTVLSGSEDKEGEFLNFLIEGIENGKYEALAYLLNNPDKISEDWTEQAISPMFEKLDLSFLDGEEKTNLFRLIEAQDFDLALSIVELDSLGDLQAQVY